MSLLRLPFVRGSAFLAVAFLLISNSSPLCAQTATTPAPAQPAPPSLTPEQLAQQTATEKEHQREMDLLGIKTLRQGASNDPGAPNYANYDDTKASPYPNVSDALFLANGKLGAGVFLEKQARSNDVVLPLGNCLLAFLLQPGFQV